MFWSVARACKSLQSPDQAWDYWPEYFDNAFLSAFRFISLTHACNESQAT